MVSYLAFIKTYFQIEEKCLLINENEFTSNSLNLIADLLCTFYFIRLATLQSGDTAVPRHLETFK